MTDNTFTNIAVKHGRDMYQMGKEAGREENEDRRKEIETIMDAFEKLQESVDKLVELTKENSDDIWKLLSKGN